MTVPIRRVAVLGAGVMGSGIAAHCANAGIPVVLLDIVPPEGKGGKGGRNAFAEGAIEKLKALPAGPTNFHFLSISFDAIDTPAVLRGYGRQYRYDSNHWSFVTGNIEQIREMAAEFGVPITPDGGNFNHGFRTAIFDTVGRLQTMWPVGGDMTDTIVSEIVKAAATHPTPPSAAQQTK